MIKQGFTIDPHTTFQIQQRGAYDDKRIDNMYYRFNNESSSKVGVNMTFETLCSIKKLQTSHFIEYWLDQIQYWKTIALKGEYWNSNTASIADVSCNERIEFASNKVTELTGYSL